MRSDDCSMHTRFVMIAVLKNVSCGVQRGNTKYALPKFHKLSENLVLKKTGCLHKTFKNL